jgi:hypothetical protein
MAKKVPSFQIKRDGSDVNTHVRISRISNGFVVKTGDSPVHYETIEAAADAIAAGLKALKWPETDNLKSKS